MKYFVVSIILIQFTISGCKETKKEVKDDQVTNISAYYDTLTREHAKWRAEQSNYFERITALSENARKGIELSDPLTELLDSAGRTNIIALNRFNSLTEVDNEIRLKGQVINKVLMLASIYHKEFRTYINSLSERDFKKRKEAEDELRQRFQKLEAAHRSYLYADSLFRVKHHFIEISNGSTEKP